MIAEFKTIVNLIPEFRKKTFKICYLVSEKMLVKDLCITIQNLVNLPTKSNKMEVKWGSEYQTILIFEGSKRGWMPFEYRSPQPFESQINGRYLVFLFTCPVFE